MKTLINVSKDVPVANLNLVPCKINYTGPSNAREYFAPSKQNESIQNKDVVTANFRGLKLVGEQVDLQKKSGFICVSMECANEKNERSEGIDPIREYKSIAQFNNFTIYGHDYCPSDSNKWKMISEWDSVSSAIHT